MQFFILVARVILYLYPKIKETLMQLIVEVESFELSYRPYKERALTN